MGRNKTLELRSRIEAINTEIDEQRDFIEYAASATYEYEMAKARIKSLKQERDKLKELLGE